MTLGPFPVHDAALDHLLTAMDSCYTVNDEGDPELIGEFSMHQLLNFYSGYDESKLILEHEECGCEYYTYPDPIYSEHDVIRALVEEVKRLRNV